MISIVSSTILATTVFLFLLLPGILLLHSFWRSDRGTLNTDNIYQYVVWGILISCAIYLGLIPLGIIVFRLPADRIWCFLIGEQDPFFFKYILWKITLFFILSPLLGWFLGKAIGYMILKLKWDISYNLKFRSEWFYTLTGRGFETHDEKSEEILVVAELLCEQKDAVIIYSGRVKDFKLKKGDLDYILLTQVERQVLIAPKKNTWDFRAFPEEKEQVEKKTNVLPKKEKIIGRFMFFKEPEIKNINIKYLVHPLRGGKRPTPLQFTTNATTGMTSFQIPKMTGFGKLCIFNSADSECFQLQIDTDDPNLDVEVDLTRWDSGLYKVIFTSNKGEVFACLIVLG